jgi:DNA-binding NarL/FixJ family response regulator
VSSDVDEIRPSSHSTVLVLHRVPVYRIGLVLGLEREGFAVAEISCLEDTDGLLWDVCLTQFDMPEAPRVITTLRESQPHAPVVVVISDPTVTSYRLAIGAGADGVASRDTGLPEIVGVLRTAMDGGMLLPAEVVRALVQQPTPTPDDLQLQDQTVSWLRALSRGESVAGIARAAGYSERQMYRMMQQVYRKIGANNRQHAIVLATRWGLIPGD